MPNYPSGTFNVRVYGIFMKDGKLLISDELFNGIKMTKFPGGGLQYGEGTIDCLKREFVEEFGFKIEVVEHFYTTDYFQKALFFEETQLISIYYLIDILSVNNIPTIQHNVEASEENPQILRFTALDEVNSNDFTFPIDQKVVEMIKQRF